MQAENGVNFAYAKDRVSADFPENLNRIGITRRIEIRVASPNLVHTSSVGPGASLQAQDINVGLKIKISQTNALLPQAIVPILSFPTGVVTQTSGSYDPAVIAVWQQAVDGFSIGENLGWAYLSADGSRKAHWSPSVSVGRAITSRLAWFGEYAPTLAAGSGPLHIVDAGLTFAPSALRQFDLRIGYQNDSNGFHNLISVGYSFRFDGLQRSLPSVAVERTK